MFSFAGLKYLSIGVALVPFVVKMFHANRFKEVADFLVSIRFREDPKSPGEHTSATVPRNSKMYVERRT